MNNSNSDFILAVHALVFLNHTATNQTSEALAANICTNPSRVRRVMAQLQKAGLVETREGRTNGGYLFVRKPECVTLAQIAQALGTRFVQTNWKSGDPHMTCRIASGIAGVMDGMMDTLNQACMHCLQEQTVQDVQAQLFAAPSADAAARLGQSDGSPTVSDTTNFEQNGEH